jgi:hypothetical protein
LVNAPPFDALLPKPAKNVLASVQDLELLLTSGSEFDTSEFLYLCREPLAAPAPRWRRRRCRAGAATAKNEEGVLRVMEFKDDRPVDHDYQSAKRRIGGRLTIRVPASLHQELVEAAAADGVSLNQFVCALLASGMQWRQGGGGDAPEPETGNNRISQEEWSRIWRRAIG